MKKRKVWKWVGIALLLATLGLAGMIWWNLNGPPWGEWMMKRGAMKYLSETYPEEHFRIVEVEKRRPLFYGWILNVHVESEEHPGEVFDLAMTFKGEVRKDHRLLRRQERRFEALETEYDRKAREALGTKFATDMKHVWTNLSSGTDMGDPGSFNVQDLDPEGEVDLRAMSAVRGHIELEFVREDRSVEAVSDLFTEIRGRLAQAGLDARFIRLKLRSTDEAEGEPIIYDLPRRVKDEEMEAYLREQSE